MAEVTKEYMAGIATQQLIDELVSRCSPACFIGTKSEGKDTWMSFTRTNGNWATCYGLCHELAFEIQEKMIKSHMEI